MKRAGIVAFLIFFLIALAIAPSLAENKNAEVEMGRNYAKQVEEQYKLLTDKAVTERIDRIGQALAKIANEQEVKARYGSSKIIKFNYEFKVVEDKDVNAFSLPGGHIYVNSGLLDLVKSDDEIAGVLAHEIAHASHHHMVQLIRKQTTVDRYVALISLAGILGNMRSNDLNNLLYGAQLLKVGKMSSYTMEAERDADRTAVAYLAKSAYNPEGMLSFMKKLDEKRDANPTVPMGIYQDHPSPFRRVASIAKAMREEGIKIDMRQVRGVAWATTTPVDEKKDCYAVTIGGKVVCAPASLKSGTTSKERAQAIAGLINKMLDSGLTCKDLTEDVSGNRLLIRGQEVLKLEAADTALMGQNNKPTLDEAKSALQYAIWADWLCERCPVLKEADEDSD